jgi:hypothetical protein
VDKNNMAMVLEGFVNLQICNGYKPFFQTQNWIEMVMSKIASEIFEYFTNSTYDEAKKSADDIGKLIFEYMKDTAIRGGDKIEEIREKVGVRVSSIMITHPVFDQETLKQLQKAWSAAQEKIATEMAGEAEGNAAQKRMKGYIAALEALAPVLEEHSLLEPYVLMDRAGGGKSEGGGGEIAQLILLPFVMSMLNRLMEKPSTDPNKS